MQTKDTSASLAVRLALLVFVGVLLFGGFFFLYPYLFSVSDGLPEVSPTPAPTQRAIDRIVPNAPAAPVR